MVITYASLALLRGPTQHLKVTEYPEILRFADHPHGLKMIQPEPTSSMAPKTHKGERIIRRCI